MAKLLTGTRIYGTGTVDTQLFVSGTNSATSTTTGALQVVGGVGIGGNLYVGGTIFGGTITGTASTATNADNIKTVLQTSSSSHYLAFVDSNNSTAAYEALYTTSSFIVNPQSGNIGIGATPATKLHVYGSGGTTLRLQTASTSSGNFIDFYTPVGIRQGYIGTVDNTGQFFIHNELPTALIFDTNNTERLRITGTGSVGIGTNSPSYPLHLLTTSTTAAAFRNSASTTTQILVGNTAGDTTIRTAGSGDSFIFSDTSKYLAFGTGATERLRITANGGISFGGSGTAYGVSGQILQSNGDAAPTWISTGSLAAANATTATHLSGGTAGQVPYQTAPGVTSFYGPGTAGNVLVSNGTGAPTYNNTLTLTGTTNATSTTTGALQVVGGVGVGGDLFIRGDIATNDTTFNLINSTATTVNFAGAATTLTMGASGSGTTNVRNNLTVSGNLTVQGTTTIVDSTVTNIADPIITLGGGTGNTAPTADDNKDRGVAFKWVNDGGTTSTGFFGYDDSTGHFTYVQTATITNEVVSGTKGAMDVNLAGGSAMAIVYQSSPNNTAFLAAGSSGFILQTNGTGSAPTWVSASGVSAGSATNADNIRTILQAGNAVYYPTFVDSNNASHAYESVYTTGTFVINPATGNIGMGTASPQRPLHVVAIGTATQGIAAFEAKASGFVIQDNGSQNGNVELVGYKQTSSTYHNILIRGAGDGLLVQTGTGNVGIGDTSPGTKLTVLGAGGSTLGTNGYLVHVGGTDSSVDPVRYMIGFSHGNNSTSTNVRAAIGSMITTGGAGNLIFETGGSFSGQVERMRITGSGGVSFGTGGANYGSSGQILQSNGNAAPTWVTAISGSSAQVNTVLRTTSAAHYLTFVDSNNASATAESIYTTSSFSINPQSGNVGIGTTSPGSKLEIKYGVQSALTLPLTLNPGFYQAGSATGIGFLTDGDTTYTKGALVYTSNGTGWNIGDFQFLMRNDNNTNPVTLSDAVMTIYRNGNVGIGTTTPNTKLDVVGAKNVAAINITQSAPTVANTFDDYVAIDFRMYNEIYPATQFTGNPAARISSYLEGGGNVFGLDFWTRNGAGTFGKMMRLTGAGGLSFGATGTAYGSSGQVLQSNGNASPTWIALSSRTVGTSTQVNTVLQTASASYFPTFVDSNNASATAESLYTTSTFSINPATGFVNHSTGGIVVGDTTSAITLQSDYSFPLIVQRSGNSGKGAIVMRGSDTIGTAIEHGRSNVASHWGTYQAFLVHDDNTSDALTSIKEKMRINATGVGIGTTTPSGRLHIYQTAGGANQLTLDTNFASGNAFAINPFITSVSNGGFSIRDVTNSVDRLVIQYSTGNVGIGTTAPDSKLHVEVGNATAYTPANTLVSGQTARISNTDATSGVSANLLFVAKGAGGGNGLGSISGVNTGVGSLAFTFGTRHSSSNVTERMRITSDGNVVIGATTTTNKFEVAGTAGQLFSVSDSFTGTIFAASDVSGIPSIEVLDTGLVKLAQYNGAVTIGTGTVSSSTAELSVYGMLYTSGPQGEIRASNEITAYFSSDRRLKENIKLIENPITILDQIRGVTFDWTDEHLARRGGEDGYFVRKHDIGVIAQEVQAVLPELVGTREDGYLAVKYEKMVALLIEAIKEQQKSIDMLKIELEKIKKQ